MHAILDDGIILCLHLDEHMQFSIGFQFHYNVSVIRVPLYQGMDSILAGYKS